MNFHNRWFIEIWIYSTQQQLNCPWTQLILLHVNSLHMKRMSKKTISQTCWPKRASCIGVYTTKLSWISILTKHSRGTIVAESKCYIIYLFSPTLVARFQTNVFWMFHIILSKPYLILVLCQMTLLAQRKLFTKYAYEMVDDDDFILDEMTWPYTSGTFLPWQIQVWNSSERWIYSKLA